VPLHVHCQQQEQLDWQSVFIRDNFLVIGYFAWVGFQQMGSGALLCDIQLPPAEAELRFHSWDFTSRFLSHQCLTNYLQTLKIPTTSLITASEEYNPQREIMLIIQAGESIEIVLLKSRVASPPAAYQLVIDRWSEFMTDSLPLMISNHLQVSLPEVPGEEFSKCVEDSQLISQKNKYQYIQPLKNWLDILVWLILSLIFYCLKPYLNITGRILANGKHS
jgi:hypothetical protein